MHRDTQAKIRCCFSGEIRKPKFNQSKKPKVTEHGNKNINLTVYLLLFSGGPSLTSRQDRFKCSERRPAATRFGSGDI
jgi:hypothetical protein